VTAAEPHGNPARSRQAVAARRASRPPRGAPKAIGAWSGGARAAVCAGAGWLAESRVAPM